MQGILGCHAKQAVIAIAERGGSQRGAGQIIHGVLMADHIRQRGARLEVSRRKSGTKAANASCSSIVLFYAVNLAFVIHTGNKAAQHGGGHVIGVALNGGGKGQHLAAGQLVAQQAWHPKCPPQCRQSL